jgi:hypothetical protein
MFSDAFDLAQNWNEESAKDFHVFFTVEFLQGVQNP